MRDNPADGERWHDRARVRDPVNAVLQPVLGDISVQAGVIDHPGGAVDQDEAESQARQGDPDEEPRVLGDHFRHHRLAANHSASGLPQRRKLASYDSEQLLTLPFRELTVCLQRHTMNIVPHV